MKYLFILGRNPELSIAELKAFFRRTGNEYPDFVQRENSVLVELENSIEGDAIELLGGTIAIGIVLCELRNLDKTEIYYSEKNNFSYALWNFSSQNIAEDVSEYLKKRFRKEKLKASEKKLRKDLNLQNFEEDKGQHLSSKTVDEQYFIFDNLFGKIVQFSNYKKISERDMKKPVRRESLSISPRLAKIMINLSEVKENEKEVLLDPFCGIGVVLSEALLQGLKVVGVDKDKKAVENCKENLKWFKFSEENYELINDDSSEVDLKKFDISRMASEPDFGETLKKIPTQEKAKEMTKRYEKIMISVLKNLKKFVKGKFVFTAPYIRIVSKKRIGCDFENISEKTGLKLLEGFPIPEFREGQIVGRDVVVFESQ